MNAARRTAAGRGKAPRIGGRPRGAGNKPVLDKIRDNKAKLEKLLLDRALGGDIQAIEACLRRIEEAEEEEEEAAEEEGEPAPSITESSPSPPPPPSES